MKFSFLKLKSIALGALLGASFAVWAAGNYHDYNVLEETPTNVKAKLIWYDGSGNVEHIKIIDAIKSNPTQPAKDAIDDHCDEKPEECIWTPKWYDFDQDRF